MTESLTIRRFRRSDADQVWTVHERALRASDLTFIVDTPADDDLTEITDQYLNRGGEFLVGLTNEVIVATGGFQPQCDDVVEIRRMRVHPSYQRRGYGEQILVALEEKARQCGFSKTVLATNEHLDAAQKLYLEHGYTETHRETDPSTGDQFIHYRKDLRDKS